MTKQLFLLVFVCCLLSGACNSVKVRPGVCNAENTILLDELLGVWTFDAGAKSAPLTITRDPSSKTYHMQTPPPSPPGPDVNINTDFTLCAIKLCPTGKPIIFVETPASGFITDHIDPIRLIRMDDKPDIKWLFESIDPDRADFTGLNVIVQNAPPPSNDKYFLVQDTGSALFGFLKSAPGLFHGFLRK